MSDAYQRLKHRAIAINAEELAERPAEAAKWRKSRLTDIERFYLWNSTGGLCGRKGCDVPLDETRMTIEHVVPKSQMPSATWDLRNLTVLCGRCNSKKGVKPCNEIATARPFRYGPMTAVAPQQAQWAGAKD
jgi:5-methylcytosine-specific restriction endonuclease McrA